VRRELLDQRVSVNASGHPQNKEACRTERNGCIAREFAQVGEWLKPTDCKSVPPSEVRRFESFPVHQNLLQQDLLHQVSLLSRLSIALVCYVVLGVLTWTTITDLKFRTGTLVVLALFAVKSVLRRKDVLHPDESTDAE
jgi:hypothetical protein